jgi:ATP adenylyltransferase
MPLDRLFAPWRGEYVGAHAPAPGSEGCVFCRAVGQAGEPGSLVVHLSAHSVVLMNLFPYNSGHVMVAPRRHIASLGAATAEELADIWGLAQRLERVLTQAYRPHGLNLGMNLGRAAGAGVADHIHLHVVPRWNGDANFMTVVGETRVIPEDPVAACARLREIWEVAGRSSD